MLNVKNIWLGFLLLKTFEIGGPRPYNTGASLAKIYPQLSPLRIASLVLYYSFGLQQLSACPSLSLNLNQSLFLFLQIKIQFNSPNS